MSIELIKNRLVALTEAVPGTGRVYNRWRYLPQHVNEQYLRMMFGVDAPQDWSRDWLVNVWMWHRVGRIEKRESLGDSDVAVLSLTHEMVLQGFVEIEDEQDSETRVQLLADAITAQFAPLDSLHEVALLWELPRLMAYPDGWTATIMDIYECHSIKLRMDVTEFINNSDPDAGISLSYGP